MEREESDDSMKRSKKEKRIKYFELKMIYGKKMSFYFFLCLENGVE